MSWVISGAHVGIVNEDKGVVIYVFDEPSQDWQEVMCISDFEGYSGLEISTKESPYIRYFQAPL